MVLIPGGIKKKKKEFRMYHCGANTHIEVEKDPMGYFYIFFPPFHNIVIIM